jgi:uncharacterized protein (DUF1499 family)
MKAAILTQPRTEILKEDAIFLHATFTTDKMSYIDDFEVLVDPTTNLVHFRSASREGWHDMFANRKRVDTIKTQLALELAKQ